MLRDLHHRPGCFNGTSGATPVVAGAAALIVSSGVASTPQQIGDFLLTKAVVDRGDPGPDNVYGAGELTLPTPTSPPRRSRR